MIQEYLVDKQRKNIYNISHDNGYESINTSKYKLARQRFAAQCDFRWKIWFWLFCWWP